MKFHETRVPGVRVVELEKHEDQRGHFARVWCEREVEAAELESGMVQANTGFSDAKGTLRGMHYQRPPHQEIKLVRCTRGAVYDVAVDLRPSSPTFREWYGLELTPDDGRMLWIPEGCAHGYQTLRDGSELFYFTSEFYAPESATGVRYDDPAFGIEWPLEVTTISDADRAWPLAS